MSDMFDQAAQYASEIEALRQQVKTSLGKYSDIVQAITDHENQPSQYGTVTLDYHLAALKQSQGEPVYYEIETPDGIKWVGAKPTILANHTSKPLYYTSAPTIPAVVPMELIQAAKAVIERWDSPQWKDVPHTGEFIARLREAVLAVKGNAKLTGLAPEGDKS